MQEKVFDNTNNHYLKDYLKMRAFKKRDLTRIISKKHSQYEAYAYLSDGKSGNYFMTDDFCIYSYLDVTFGGVHDIANSKMKIFNNVVIRLKNKEAYKLFPSFHEYQISSELSVYQPVPMKEVMGEIPPKISEISSKLARTIVSDLSNQKDIMYIDAKFLYFMQKYACKGR